eukprot:4510881-Pleurochrysis_carterae.AAC.1
MQRAVAATTVARHLLPERTDTPRGERQRALWITMSPCASGYQLNTRANRAKTQKYQCQNMQMRMHGDQSRNIQLQSDPRDRGN